MALQAISQLVRAMGMHLKRLVGVFAFMASLAAQATETPAQPSLQQDGRYRNQAQLPRDGVLKKLRIGFKFCQ